jgi:hypothetical protein
VPGDVVAAAPLHVADHALEPLVGERLDPAAVVADDVVMMLGGVATGLFLVAAAVEALRARA